MEQQDYTCRIETGVTAREAFDGINQVSGWWAANFEGNSQKLGDVFTVHFGETCATFKIIEIVPDKKIVWLTIDSYLDLLKNKQEWKGTKIVWEISTENNSTQITMTHVGLVPGIECYNDCIKGWDFYVKESLYGFLTRDKGLPGTGIMATISNGDRTYKGTLFSKNDPAPDVSNDYIVIDVKETKVEHVTAIYSVGVYNKEIFIAGQITGNYFMIVENKPIQGNILPLDDLKTIIHKMNR
ncbi:MAG TPA: hypothetical protein VGN20_10010 [Mucilaginibacter sp.]|jgi:hypothetical protein